MTDAAIVLGRLPAALIGGEIKLDLDAARAAYDEARREFGMTRGGSRRRRPRDRRGQPGLRHPPGDHVARPRARPTTPWSPSAAPAGCSPPRSPTSSASPPSSRRPTPATSAPSGCMSRTCGATISARSSAGSRRPTAPRSSPRGTRSRTPALADIKAEGIAEDRIALRRVADVRYFGEGHEVQVDIPAELDGEAAIAHMWNEFHKVHDRTFGFHYEGEQDVELVNLRVQAVGVQHRPALDAGRRPARTPAAPFAARARPIGGRPAGSNARSTAGRSSPSARAIAGPAIVEEYGSTVVVPDGVGRSGPTPTAISSSRRPVEEAPDARQGGDTAASSARSSSR